MADPAPTGLDRSTLPRSLGADPSAAAAGASATAAALTSGAALVGGLSGGIIGGASALGLAAVLAGINEESSLLPLLVLPSLLCGAGAAAGGGIAGGSASAYAAGVGGILGAGLTTVVLGVLVLNTGQVGVGLDTTFVSLVAGPALLGALLAAAAAPFFVRLEDSIDVQFEEPVTAP